MPLWLLVAWPLACALGAAILGRPRGILALGVVGSVAEVALFLAVAPAGLAGRVFGVGQQLLLDPLSTFHLGLVVAVFALSSIYACYSFAPQLASGALTPGKARRFGAAWFAFLGAMTLMLVANNVGLMWMAMEATTLSSAVLICLEFDRGSLRAAWAYLLICSVGIALALLGTFVLCGEARTAGGGQSPFLWTELQAIAPRCAAPVRLCVPLPWSGHGTKTGCAHARGCPMRTAMPSPVSAVLSGVLLNCAIYCITTSSPSPSHHDHGGWALGLPALRPGVDRRGGVHRPRARRSGCSPSTASSTWASSRSASVRVAGGGALPHVQPFGLQDGDVLALAPWRSASAPGTCAACTRHPRRHAGGRHRPVARPARSSACRRSPSS